MELDDFDGEDLFEDEDDSYYDIRDLAATLNTVLFKIDDVQNSLDLEELESRINRCMNHLIELDLKVTENMSRLNDMIKEFKGLVQIVRGQTAK